jgi:DNA end-binding protein Ku
MVKGYEYRKGRYVVFEDAELKALDEKATHGIEITEFLPADAVDPVYFEKTYYLGPDKGGEKGYSLLAAAMGKVKDAALAQYAARGKSYLVLVRSTGDRLFMQQLYHSDEVRDIDEVPREPRKSSEAEVRLAMQLIEQIRSDVFKPDKYEDQVRRRVEKLIQAKIKGKDITEEEPAPARKGEVVDIMEALKASLGKPPAQRALKPAARRSTRSGQRKAS